MAAANHGENVFTKLILINLGERRLGRVNQSRDGNRVAKARRNRFRLNAFFDIPLAIQRNDYSLPSRIRVCGKSKAG